MNPFLAEYGLPVPVGEDAPLVREPTEDEKGYRIVRTEEAVFEHHPGALHFRYPYVYGPYQLAPREWCVVRRVLDGRARIVLPDGGLTLHHHGYTENLAHALLLAVERADVAGHVFNVGDDEVLSIRQVVEVVATALGHTFELVSMPWDVAHPARPLLMQPSPAHRVLDLTRARNLLGHRDVVPARDALAHTARWLAEHPPAAGGMEEQVLTDPFDYEAEDRLIDAWCTARASLAKVEFAIEPGYGLAYSGPGGRARTKQEFEA